jgi:nitroreductase
MELFEALTTRTSAASLAAPGPKADELARMLDAAGHAPDHGRLKPWRLIVLSEPMRHAFADAAVAARRARLPVPTDDQLRIERDKIWRSPTVVVVACAVDKSNTKIPEVEQVIAAGAAAQNLMLAAHGMGYGVMWKTGPAAYAAGVKAALGLKATDHIVSIMHLGTRLK